MERIERKGSIRPFPFHPCIEFPFVLDGLSLARP